MNRVPNCAECEHVKCIAINRKIYFCNNEERVDDMGKLAEDNLPDTNPEWCPLRKRRNKK